MTTPALPSGPIASVDEAIARMQAIAALLPPTDGLACFNRMYLLVTQTVQQHLTPGFFSSPPFMAELDVEFVNLYLAAVDAAQAGGTPPRCWNVLLQQRANGGIVPMQFALAGMNAHINHDLALAVINTCTALGTAPDDGNQHADYEKVNTLLDALDQQVRESFEDGIILELDRQVSGLENLAGNFGIQAARETAWVNATTLWHLRGERFLFDPFVDATDRTTALIGRTLLVPLPKV